MPKVKVNGVTYVGESTRAGTAPSSSETPRVKVNGVTYVGKDSENPYGQIAKAYAKQQNANYKQQKTALKKQLAKSKNATVADFNSNSAQTYINYMRERNALPEQLRAQGVNGGASETALVNMQNQYALNRSNNSAARSSALAQLRDSYATNLANLRQQRNDAILNNNVAMAQQQVAYDDAQRKYEREYEDTKQQRELEQYSATLERFITVDGVNKAIKKLKKSDPNYKAKKQLLQLRRAQIKQAEAEQAAASGGGYGGYSGGGGGGYSSGYGGYGGGDTTSTTTYTPTTVYNQGDVGPYLPSGSTSTTRTSKSTRGGNKYTVRRNLSRAGIW